MTHEKETAGPHRLDNRLLLLTEQISKALQQQLQQRNATANNLFTLHKLTNSRCGSRTVNSATPETQHPGQQTGLRLLYGASAARCCR
jgi:hypothetical protein